MKPKGAKQKKPLKQDKAISMSITLPKSQAERFNHLSHLEGISRGKLVINLMDIYKKL